MVILRRRTINDEKDQKIESNENEAKQIDGTAKENIDKTKEIIDNRAKDTNGFNVSDALLDTDVEIDPTNIDVDQPVKYQCCNKSTSETEPEIEINVTETKNNHGPIAEDEGTNIVHLSQISERNLLPQTSDIEAVNYIEPLNKCSSEEKQFTHDSPQGNQNRGYLNHEFKQKENSFCEWSNVKLKSKDYPRYNAITNASKLISKKSDFKELTENAVQYIHFDTMSGLIIVADNIYIYHYGYCQSVLIRGERKITFTKMSRYSLVMTKSSLYCLKQTAWLFEEVDNPKSIYFCAEMASVVIYAVPYLPTSYLDLAHYFNRPVERENRNSNTGELLDPLRIGNTVSTSQDHTVSNRDDGTMSRSGATSIVALERRNILMGVQNRNRNHFLHYRHQMLSSYFQMQRSNRHSLAMYQHNMFNSRAQHRYRSLNHTQTEPPGMRLPHLSETVSYEGRLRTLVVAVRPEASGRSHNIENEIKTGTRTSQHSNTRVTIVDPEATERRLYMENELPRGTLMAQGSDTLFSAEQFETHVTVLPPSESRPITETVNQTVRTPGTQGSDTLTPAERFETRVTFVPPSGNRPLTETENQTESSTRGSSGHHGTGAIRFCTCCDVKVIAVMFLPCRHAVCCKDCSERFTVCDQCRMQIKDKRSLN